MDGFDPATFLEQMTGRIQTILGDAASAGNSSLR